MGGAPPDPGAVYDSAAQRVDPAQPVLYVDIGARRFVIGSKGGAPTNPAWYENLVANSRVRVRVMAEVYEATARPLGVDDRAVVWPTIVERYPIFGEYQANSDRMIPVVELVCI